MKLNEKQAFKVTEETLNWLGIEITEDKTGLGVVTKQEIAGFVMLNLINKEL